MAEREGAPGRSDVPATSTPSRLFDSIRFRITAVATLVVAVVLVVAAVLAVSAQRRALTESLDDRLHARADDIAALLAGSGIPDELSTEGGDDSLAQVVALDGTVLTASPNIAGTAAVAPTPSEISTLRTVDDLPIDDDQFRMLSQRIGIASGPAILHVAETVDEIDESVEVLTLSLAVILPIVAAIVAALVWFVVGRALRPVDAIRSEVERIGGTALDRRVPEPRSHDEIGRLARTMNEMLGRLENSHARQERFVADASHELRSPLTSIRSELEVDLAHPERADLAATHRSILEETQRLQQLVDDLLLLARSDAGELPRGEDAVDLDEVVIDEVRSARRRTSTTLDTTRVSGAQVIGDRDQLSRAVRNLVDNAARHAAGTVQLSLTETDEEVALTVDDDGPGIPTEEAERLFERFARLDTARRASDGGTGLGLAITLEIARLHQGSVSAGQAPLGGARFVLRLPPAAARRA